MATVDELLVRIDASTEQLRREMARADRSVEGFRRSVERETSRVDRAFASVGLGIRRAFGTFGIGLGVGAAAGGIKAMIDSVAELGDTASIVGVSVERLQTLRFAADQTGASAAMMDDALRRLNRRLGLAAQGGGPAAAAFERLGIEVRDAGGATRSVESVFDDAVRALEEVASQAERSALASQLFGEDSGPKLVPLLAQGQAGIAALAEQARRSGVVLDEELVQRAQEISDRWAHLSLVIGTQARGAILAFADAVASSFGGPVDSATASLAELRAELERVNQELAPFQTGLDEGGGGGGMQAGIVDALIRRRIELSRQIRALEESAPEAPAAPALPPPATVPTVAPPSTGGRSSLPRADEVEEATNALGAFLRRLDDERRLAGLTTREREIQRALLEAQRLSMEQGNLLSEAQLDAIRETVGATYDLEQATRGANAALKDTNTFAAELGDTLARALGDAARSFEDLGDVGRAVLAELQSLIAETFVVGPFRDLLTGGKGGGLLGQAFDALGGLFGFGGKRAAGGPVTSGAAYLVGERGPELFVPKTDGFVMSNAATAAMSAGGGGGTVNVVNNYRFDGQSGPTRAELVAVLEQNRQITLAELQDRMSRGGSFARAVRGR